MFPPVEQKFNRVGPFVFKKKKEDRREMQEFVNSLRRSMRSFLIVSDDTRAGATYKLLDSRFRTNESKCFFAQ